MGWKNTANDQRMSLLHTGCSAAFDFTVTSPLFSNNLPKASVTAGSAAFVADRRMEASSQPGFDVRVAINALICVVRLLIIACFCSYVIITTRHQPQHIQTHKDKKHNFTELYLLSF